MSVAGGTGTAKVNRILRAMEEPMSLDSPVGGEESSQLGDFIEDVDARNHWMLLVREMLREFVQERPGSPLRKRAPGIRDCALALWMVKTIHWKKLANILNVTTRTYPPD